MKKQLVMIGLAPMLVLGACGTKTENSTTTTTTLENVGAEPENTFDAMLTGVPASPDQAFADAVGASDWFEVEAGKLAQEKATTQALKNFGGMMVTGHTATTEALKAAAVKATPALVPNPVLNAEQETNLAALRQASGAAFDAAYKAQQVAAHEKALTLLKDYAATGGVPALKTFAGDTAKIVDMHLTRIKGM